MGVGTFPSKEIAFSGLVVIGLAYILPQEQFFALIIPAGYAHFAAAWLYQFKAGRMSNTFGVALLILALGVAAIVASISLVWQIVIASCFFILHHFFDEFRLLGDEVTPRRLAELSVPVLLYASVFVRSVFNSSFVSTVGSITAICMLMIVIFNIARKEQGYRADYFTMYALLIALPLAWFFFQGTLLVPGVLIGVLIYYHYSRWYLYSYRRMPAASSVRKAYVRNMLVLNALFFGTYIISGTFYQHAWLISLFTPTAFYFMTIVHIASSCMQFGFRRRTSNERVVA